MEIDQQHMRRAVLAEIERQVPRNLRVKDQLVPDRVHVFDEILTREITALAYGPDAATGMFNNNENSPSALWGELAKTRGRSRLAIGLSRQERSAFHTKRRQGFE